MSSIRPERIDPQHVDIAIIGGGIAGLSLALSLPSALHIALLTKGVLGESNTRYAQGGLAAAVSSDDSPDLHFRDTLIAGAGLCDEQAVRILVEDAPAAVRWLIDLGAQFDRKPAAEDMATSGFQAYVMGHEAAHSRRRVLHAQGDATGAEIERALVAALRERANITLYERSFASDLLVAAGACVGVQALDASGAPFQVFAERTILANGGAGRLWLRTSNPPLATADGLALAWHAGAALADVEFTQFHPTILVTPEETGSAFLISEAVRGEGAYLRNQAGERFMPHYHPNAELAPRDVVARAILSEMLREGAPSAYLDLRHLPAAAMRARFPTIAAICAQHSLDLARDLIPVAPAAHYFMGGVAVDPWGRTTLPALYALGEAACTGVHGANRLASNSLLEGLVFGRRVAKALARTLTTSRHDGAISDWPTTDRLFTGKTSSTRTISTAAPTPNGPLVDARIQGALQRVMWEQVSLYRDENGLQHAAETVQRLREVVQAVSQYAEERGGSPASFDAGISPFVGYETSNMLQIAQIIITAARQRRESRGSHYRTDFPTADPALAGQHTLLRNSALGRVHQANQVLQEAISYV